MNKIEELKKIKQMLDDGILSESEYTLLKSEIINNLPANNLFISENIEIENDNQSSIDVEDIDTEGELPFVKPHFGKKGVVLFFSIIAILVVIYQLNDKGLISFKNKTEISDNNIKDLADLETYINNEADSYCESWHKTIAYNNEQKNHEEWVRLDGRILNFEIQIIPLLVKNNDLPDEYVKKGADFFNKRLSNCGYYYYGGSPPEMNLNESNKIDESQAIEPVIINHEYDTTDSTEYENDTKNLIRTNIENDSNGVNIKLGSYYHGGIIFYLDYEGKHGLIRTNTIEKQDGFTWDMAKKASEEYANNGFGNWYLPESEELKMIFANKNDNLLKDGKYWCLLDGSKNGNFLGYSSSDNSFWTASRDYRVPMAIFISKF